MRGVQLNAYTASNNAEYQMKQGANRTLYKRHAYFWINQHKANALESRVARKRAFDHRGILKICLLFVTACI